MGFGSGGGSGSTGGGGTPGTGIVLLSSTVVNLNLLNTLQPLYTCPTARRAVITNIVMHKASADPSFAVIEAGWGSPANNVSSASFLVADAGLSMASAVVWNVSSPGLGATPLIGAPIIGTAGDVLNAKVLTPEGSALTCVFDVFGYLTSTAGVPSSNILIP